MLEWMAAARGQFESIFPGVPLAEHWLPSQTKRWKENLDVFSFRQRSEGRLGYYGTGRQLGKIMLHRRRAALVHGVVASYWGLLTQMPHIRRSGWDTGIGKPMIIWTGCSKHLMGPG